MKTLVKFHQIQVIPAALLLLLNLNGRPILAQDQNLKDWEITIPNDQTARLVIPGDSKYGFYNKTIRKSIKYGERKYGINLVWTDQSLRKIRLERLPKSDGPIKYGQKVAIYVGPGGYLRYEKRKYGINLVWSKTPAYQWEIRGGDANEDVQTRTRIALYNDVEKDYILYCERYWGINLRWSKDCDETSADQTSNLSLALRLGPWTSPTSSGKCTGRVIWTFTPVNLTGSSGKNISFTIDKNYEVTEQQVAAGKYYCFYREVGASGLRAGVWRVKVQTPLWGTECEVTLHRGNNIVNFSVNRGGCKQGFDFPGD